MGETRTYKIVKGRGLSNFLCPPGHWNHTYRLEEYSSPRGRTVQNTFTIDYAEDPSSLASDHIRQEVQRIKAEAELVASEAWVRDVYGYFRSMYVPESGERNADKLISFHPVEEVEKATRQVLREAGFKRASGILSGGNGYEVTVARDASKVFVYHVAEGERVKGAGELLDYYSALEAAGFSDVETQAATEKHTTRVRATPIEVPSSMPPERHAAVALIREYFPDHEPRVDLINNPGKGYGAYPCSKCGEVVQYEARFDAHAILHTRTIPGKGTEVTYTTECKVGGKHTVED